MDPVPAGVVGPVAGTFLHQRGRDAVDADAARLLVHSLKGTAGNLSAVSIEFAATELEKGLKEQDAARVPELISNFMEALRQLQRSLERVPV